MSETLGNVALRILSEPMIRAQYILITVVINVIIIKQCYREHQGVGGWGPEAGVPYVKPGSSEKPHREKETVES